MEAIPFYIVDVFADAPYRGNQLAVFLQADSLSTACMQKIAQEIGFAESVFVMPGPENEDGIDIRIFTVEYEVPFAGHPTLGCAYVVQQFMLQQPVAMVKLNTKIGQIPVSVTYADNKPEFLAMQQVNPAFGPTFAKAEVATVLGLPETALSPQFPVQQVSTGLPFLIIPVLSLADQNKIMISAEVLSNFLRKNGLHKTDRADGVTVALYCFCPETYSPDNQLNGRMLALENDRIIEDAATGSANGCLLAYLLKHDYFQSETVLNLKVEQGYEIGRNSTLHLHGQRMSATNFKIKVGGQVQLIAKGEWFIHPDAS